MSRVAYVGNISVGGWHGLNYNQLEIRSNGFLDAFLAAQRNLAAGGTEQGRIHRRARQAVCTGRGIPTSLNNYILQGQVALRCQLHRHDGPMDQGTYGGLVAKAGLAETSSA